MSRKASASDDGGPPLTPLSDQDAAFWNREGYLAVSEALSADEVDRYLRLAEGLVGRIATLKSENEDWKFGNAGNNRDLDLISLLQAESGFAPLLDHPEILGRVLGLMGPYIRVPSVELVIRFPHGEPLLELHTDGGPALKRIHPHPNSLVLQLKVQIFLTDLSVENRGNMVVVPRSHNQPFSSASAAEAQANGRQLQFVARSGDAIIFPWSLWHGVAPNTGNDPRISIIIRYTQMFMQPVESVPIASDVAHILSERRRTLLGVNMATVGEINPYRPDVREVLNALACGNDANRNLLRSFYPDSAAIKALYDKDDRLD
jgi:hypothetical protein